MTYKLEYKEIEESLVGKILNMDKLAALTVKNINDQIETRMKKTV